MAIMKIEIGLFCAALLAGCSEGHGHMTAWLCDAGDEACSAAPLLLLCHQVDDLRS
jgi:hypothetical protein